MSIRAIGLYTHGAAGGYAAMDNRSAITVLPQP